MMDNRDETPLFIAVTIGAYSTINLLLKHDAPAICQDLVGKPPIYRASSSRPCCCSKASTWLGASDNSNTRLGRSPLHEAFENKNRAMVELLCQYGALSCP